MFDVWSTLGDVASVPVSVQVLDAAGNAKRTFRPGEAIRFRVTGAANTGVLLAISQGATVVQAANWGGQKTGAAPIPGEPFGSVEWVQAAPTAAGAYRFTFIVPIIGLAPDPQAAVDLTVSGAPVVTVDDDVLGPIIEDGGGFHIPKEITIFGITMSPLMLVGAAGLAWLAFKGK